MKIVRVTSHVLRYELEEELGYSQQYFTQRTAHLVEVETDPMPSRPRRRESRPRASPRPK